MRTIILSLSLLFVSLLGQSQCINGLVPKPVQILSNNQEFIINQKTTLIIDDGVDKNFRSLFNEKFSPAMGFDLLVKSPLKKNIQKNYIRFKLTDDVSLGREGYKLKVTSDGIDVVAGGYGGCYYALETLRQLLPASIYGQSKVADMKWSVPGVEITDYPRFGWRGMMLDVSRIFSDLEYVKKYIDWLAAHKLNIFHWHLTDDQGWRIEIKKYPKLTEIGAWRGEGEVLRAYCSVGTGRYGGFYTQDQIKEVIAYAAVRNVEIIPEIDMPGHSRAATASYPEIFCNSKEQLSGAQGQIQNVWCAGREANYEMLKDIIDEITALFPSKYIHIGGDEVNKSYWKNCTHCQELMKKRGAQQ